MSDEQMQFKKNEPTERIYRPLKLSTNEIREGCISITGGDGEETRLCVVNEELRQGIDFVSKFAQTVTFFGSARFEEGNEYYEKARRIARRISEELEYAVVTGGGPGIMEAGNRGASEGKGASIGMTIQLPFEQTTNSYVSDAISFYFFFTRKVALTYSAEVYVYFPGGFGTLDEFFEILTLKQTQKISPVPIILVGKEFWTPVVKLIEHDLLERHKTISPQDVGLYYMTDDEDEIIEIIKHAPRRDE